MSKTNNGLNNNFKPKDNENKGITPEGIKGEIKRLQKVAEKAKQTKGLFSVKTANQWIKEAKNRDIPNMLFDAFWSENELCILFADSGLGKSILSVQIGESISTGKPIQGFKNTAKAQKVLCFDLELTDKMFEKRYSNDYANHYHFNDNFYRVEINPDAEIPEGQSFESYLNSSLELSIQETGAKVIIIDNLTYLRSETERAKDALPLMKQLKALKSKYNLSILALAHTPKRDLSKPISRNDLQGSKMLYNFCDTVFAIGESARDNAIRYIKQLKPRNTELIYGTDNVCTCQLNKPDNFLGFEFLGFGYESEHLKEYTEKERQDRISEAKGLSDKGISGREIARQMGVSEGAVRKWLKK